MSEQLSDTFLPTLLDPSTLCTAERRTEILESAWEYLIRAFQERCTHLSHRLQRAHVSREPSLFSDLDEADGEIHYHMQLANLLIAGFQDRLITYRIEPYTARQTRAVVELLVANSD